MINRDDISESEKDEIEESLRVLFDEVLGLQEQIGDDDEPIRADMDKDAEFVRVGLEKDAEFTASPDDWIYIPGVRERLSSASTDASGNNIEFEALLIKSGGVEALKLYIEPLTGDEREIILLGCLMNYYAEKSKNA